MAFSTKDYLLHYKKRLKRCANEDEILRIFKKLVNISTTIEVFQQSGLQEVMRMYAKSNGNVGAEAKNLLQEWKKRNLLERSKTVRAPYSNFRSEKSNCFMPEIISKDKTKSEVSPKLPSKNEIEMSSKKRKILLNAVLDECIDKSTFVCHMQKDIGKSNQQCVKNNTSLCRNDVDTHADSTDVDNLASISKKSFKSKDCDKNSEGKLKSICATKQGFKPSAISFEDCLKLSDLATKNVNKSRCSKSFLKKTGKTYKSVPQKIDHTIKVKPNKNSTVFKRSGKNECTKLLKSKEPVHNAVKLMPNNYTAVSKRTGENKYSKLLKSLDEKLELKQPKIVLETTVLTDKDAIQFMSSKKEKTVIYSGKKSLITKVPSLFDISIKILIENIDLIESFGEIPYFLIEPILEKCTPKQLLNIESYNPYLLDDTQELWKIHCKVNFRIQVLPKDKTWRDLYLHTLNEREERLKSVTANISASMSRTKLARKTKLVYIDPVVKLTRKSQQSINVNPVVKLTPKSQQSIHVDPVLKLTEKSQQLNSEKNMQHNYSFNLSKNKQNVSQNNKQIVSKAKPAPLMAKALKSFKNFRR